MIARDPTHEILKAYYNLLNESIVYDGETVKVGTKIPQNTDKYVLIYVESIDNYSSAEDFVYNATVSMQIVSMQDINEGDDTVVNSIFEQVIELLGDPDAMTMDGFICLTSVPGSMERDTELTDTNYIITRKLQITNFIQQTK